MNQIADEKDWKISSKEPIKVIGKLEKGIAYNELTCENAFSTVVDKGHE